MFRKKLYKCLSIYLLKILIFGVLILLWTCKITVFATETQSSSDRVIVSLGDSYSSGEGIEPFYGQDLPLAERVKNPDWLAHRSENSWGGMLTLPGVEGKMADEQNRGTHWFFVAASGAETKHLLEKQTKDYAKKIIYHGTKELDPQLSIFDKIGKQADYVTLTLGGNDADFKEIITEVVCGSTYLKRSNLSDKINQTWVKFYEDGGIKDKLQYSYEEIARKAGKQAHIIVAGYPRLFEKNGKGIPVSKEEAILVNGAVSNFNNATERLVYQCSKQGINISFVSVESAFEGHEAYSDSEYINEVILGTKDQDLKDVGLSSLSSAYSMHPNNAGACVYAECVQDEINRLEGVKPVTYSMDLSVSAYGYDGRLCDDYTIVVDGQEEVALWGLIGKKYHDEIRVNEAKPVTVHLPKGTYTVTIRNGTDTYFKKIKTKKESDNRLLIFDTSFGHDESSEQSEQSDVPEDAAEYNGHYYYVYNVETVTTWEEAKQYCEEQGGYLATITSKEEDEFLYSYLKNNFEYESAYFGFSDREDEGNWVWDNGEEASYTNWHSGEPNGENSNEDFAMYYYKYSDGTWNDGDFGNQTVNSGTAFICEWGEYETASDYSKEEVSRETSDERDIVLVLDTSGSMSGTPIEETKKASVKFINTILKEDASIGIVTYEDSATQLCDFSVNREYLLEKADGIFGDGGTNIESGLMQAKSMLENSNAKKKIIVLMSDGEPTEGKVGEELIAYADELKQSGIFIYTLGFFENMSDEKSEAQSLMEHLASDGYHYEVANADDLVFFFQDMADQINGQKYIYVRIACPVDVTVTYRGEMLSSAEENQSLRTEFGTLTFEENESADSERKEDLIKVLRLKEGEDYNIQIVGTGRGMMNYTVGFMDDNGDYNDFRRFENVKITKRTVIDTVAAVSNESVLNIDEDGDGKYDIKMRAKENGYGKEEKINIWIYVGICGGAIFLIVVCTGIRIFKRKHRKGKVNF